MFLDLNFGRLVRGIVFLSAEKRSPNFYVDNRYEIVDDALTFVILTQFLMKVKSLYVHFAKLFLYFIE